MCLCIWVLQIVECMLHGYVRDRRWLLGWGIILMGASPNSSPYVSLAVPPLSLKAHT